MVTLESISVQEEDMVEEEICNMICRCNNE